MDGENAGHKTDRKADGQNDGLLNETTARHFREPIKTQTIYDSC